MDVGGDFGSVNGHEVDDLANTRAGEVARDQDRGVYQVQLLDDGIGIVNRHSKVATLLRVKN